MCVYIINQPCIFRPVTEHLTSFCWVNNLQEADVAITGK